MSEVTRRTVAPKSPPPIMVDEYFIVNIGGQGHIDQIREDLEALIERHNIENPGRKMLIDF